MATKLITVNINDLKETEHNPRQITKKEFEKLKKSSGNTNAIAGGCYGE